MKNNLLLLIILLISNIAYGQINAVVIDSTTKDKIPYVNIWIENENIGTTTDEQGKFVLDCHEETKVIVFSSIGYETKKVKSGLLKDTVELTAKIIELHEVVIEPNGHNMNLVIGKYEKSKINFYFACGTKPWIVARYFDFKESYKQTPYLGKIKLLTNSDVKDSRFNIRLYSADENGKPADNIYNENIIGVARKGKKVTEIDISELNAKFPRKGFFIAVEWLIIETNKYEYTYTATDSKKKLNGISYEPSVGTIPSEIDENSWIYSQGKWRKVWKNNDPIKRYKNKYNLLAIELTLTN